MLLTLSATLAVLLAAVDGASAGGRSNDPAEWRAYIGRSPDGDGFFGYVTDTAAEARPLESAGPWPTIDEALDWARVRANQIVVTYGFTQDSVFSAGVTYCDGGDPNLPLPTWPPDSTIIARVDREVRDAVTAKSPEDSNDRLGVTEPEVRNVSD
jgi:hypothetical protein